MELEHTPGPWKHEFGVVYITLENGCRKVIAKSSHSDSCIIAAAPKMINALIDLVSIVKIHSKATGSNFAWAEMEYARKAIEHATGKPIDEVIK